MIISAKLIKKSRVLRRCEECGKKMEPGSSVLRLYGAGMEGDPPYVIYVHPEACRYGNRTDPKIVAALANPPETPPQPEGREG